VSAVLHRAPTAPLLRGAATLAAAAVGVALGASLAADPPAPAPSQPPAPVALTRGPATLPLPAGWTALGRHAALPGFEDATAVRGTYGPVALDLRAPEDASLLPAAAAGKRPLPAAVRLIDGRAVWRYDLPGAEPGTSVAAAVLPTTAGVVTVACGARQTQIRAAAAECENAIGALRLDGAVALDARPAAAAAIVLRDALPALNRGRREARRRLAAARSPAARSAAALRLAELHAGTAARLRPLAAGAGARVAATLAVLARDYRALAAASRRRDARAAAAAGAAIERHDRRLARELASL
jgi:hypothetical protein